MNWFIWRQHRKQFLIIGIILALYAALIIPTGLYLWHTYQSALASCAQNPATPSCSGLAGNLFQSNTDQILLHLVPLVTLFLPILLGMFWGAPYLAKEYTDGTNSLAWTQSVSRRKWLTVKLVWMLIATIVFLTAFTALFTWWAKTPNTWNMDRFSDGFSNQGLMPVVYGLFAVSFGILFGAWFRKTMVAVGVVLGLFIVVTIPIANFARPHFMAPITVTAPMGPDAIEAKIPNDASWVISRNIVDKNGKAFNSFNLADMPQQCQQIIQQSQVGTDDHGNRVAIKATPGPGGEDPIDTCLNNAGYHQVASYQPSYRYWDFQRIETGIYLGLSALAVGATYWLVLKRDA